INDEVAMDAISRQTDEHTQIADRPNNVSEASLHGSFRRCQWLRQQGRHDAASSVCVKSKKIVRLPLKMATVARKEHPGIAQRARMLCSLSIFVIAGATGLVTPRDCARGTAHRTRIRARGIGHESLHRALDRAHFPTAR